MQRKLPLPCLALIAASLLLGSLTQVWAFHQWGCFHWPDPDITVANKAGGDYHNIYQEETWADADAWDPRTELNLLPTTKRKADLELLSGDYGFNGWLGLAQIWPRGCVIQRAQTKLNNTYLSSPSYSRTNKKHVACQEVGHTFGLDHNRVDTNTCMNDTILSAPRPNQHDFDLVNAITP